MVVGGKQLKKNCVYQYAIASSADCFITILTFERAVYHNPDMFFLKIFKSSQGMKIDKGLKELVVDRHPPVPTHEKNK